MSVARLGQKSLPLLLSMSVMMCGCSQSLLRRHLSRANGVPSASEAGQNSSGVAATAVKQPSPTSDASTISHAPASIPQSASLTFPAETADDVSAADAGEVDSQSDPSAVAWNEELAVVPIDLSTALATATGRNPQVAFARERIGEALAELETAEILWLPSLRAGLNYHIRDGNIQNTEGRIVDSQRNAFFAGLGSRAVGGGAIGVPGVWAEFHLADAIFEPRIAEHTATARRRGAQATLNDTLLMVAVAYLDLMRALQELSISQETLDNIQELAQLAEAFADVGLVPQADVDRVFTEVAVRRNTVQQSREQVQAASSRLVRWLSDEPMMLLVPQEPAVFPVELVSPEPEIGSLVETGLLQRPELAENRELVAEAVERLNRDRYAPLVPSVIMGLTYGTLGGGFGTDMRDFGDRVDFDVAAWWEIRQAGFGERAIRRAARSRVDQTRWQQVQLMDMVAQEVIESAAQVKLRRNQIPVAEDGVRRAIDSRRRNMQRLREGEGLPLEALQSIGALDQARREYLRAVIEFNEAQFRLQRALGWPVGEH